MKASEYHKAIQDLVFVPSTRDTVMSIIGDGKIHPIRELARQAGVSANAIRLLCRQMADKNVIRQGEVFYQGRRHNAIQLTQPSKPSKPTKGKRR